ncbi:MAG: phytanoyl-CoA dioxygenase family protein [Bacteroidetes bacterium]|nr:phytanoyl-CoA dioxygenase family protein [Bacteroidota bacterium]
MISEKDGLHVDFLDASIEKSILEQGFCLAPLLNQDEIAELLRSFDKLRAKAGKSIGKSFWPSGRHPDPEVRNFARESVEKMIPGKLAAYVDMDTTRFIGGTFLIKPSSKKSALNPHQDSSHVDERFGHSVYAWIPLTDTSEKNGCVYYLPGSHNWGIHQRSLNVPWPLSDIENDLWPLMKPIEMKAGQVLFFHSALIHSSSNNRSGETRVALNYYLHPSESPFCHFYTGPEVPEGRVEMFSVSPDFYYSEDFEKRPNEDKYPLIDLLDISKFDRQKYLGLI